MAEAERERLVGLVEALINKRLASNSLRLPALSSAALRIIELLEDDDASLGDLVEPANTDPLISLAILKRASAAEFGSPVDNLQQAVSRLGKIRLMRVVVEVAVSKVFVSKQPKLAADFRALHGHCLATAILAGEIAGAVGAERELCYTAGLLHDVGKIVVANMLFDIEDSLDELPAEWTDWWLDIVGTIHRGIARKIVGAWHLPDAISETVDLGSDYDPTEPKSAGNVVRYANALAKKAGFGVGAPITDEIEALLMVGRTLLGINEAAVEAALSGLDDRVKAAL